MSTELRAEHVPGAIAAAGTSAALIAQQVVGKAVRDTLFLSSFPARLLPFAMGAGAVLSLAVVLWLSRVLVRRSPAVVMPWLFAASAVGLVICWVVGLASAPISALLVYFHTALLGPVLITAFWSLINERFDPHSAKRAVARISGGGTLGGVIGGLAAWRASTLVSLPTMLLLLALLNVACAFGVLLISARKHAEPALESSRSPLREGEGEEPPTAFGVLRKTAFLRNLAYLVALGSVLSALLDYVFSAQAAAAIPKGAPLLSFFSLFWLGVGVVSFLLQIVLGRIALEKLGLAVSIAVLPGTILLGGAFGLAVPGLVSASILRGADAVQRNTLFRSAYELLYTPIPEETKRATKALIDVGFDRAGTLFGSLVIMAALRLAIQDASTVLLMAIIVTAIATLPVVRSLHKGYIETLEQGLREAAAKFERDAHSPPNVDRPSIEMDGASEARDALIDRVHALGIGPLIGPDMEKKLAVRRRPENLSQRRDKLAETMIEARKRAALLMADQRDLLSGDVLAAKRVLAKKPVDVRPIAALTIPFLAHPELQRDARRALARVAFEVTGQLADVLLDATTRTIIRRRIPRILAVCETQRSADGLVAGLLDESFEVRYECSKALRRIVSRNPTLSLPRETLTEVVMNEARLTSAQTEEPANSKLAEELIADRQERRLKHIFAILSLEFDRESLDLALKALHHEDDRHRGTALEYLETVLPRELREALWPFLGAVEPLRKPRPAEEILADLTRAVGYSAADTLSAARERVPALSRVARG